MKGRCNVNVKFSLLVIAYLEVLIWTTCLLSSCATASPLAEDTGYILRETGNLAIAQGRLPELDFEQARFGDASAVAADLKEADLAHHAERLSVQRLQHSPLFLGQQASEHKTNVFSQLFSVIKGSPAPYTGVKAIT